MSEACCTFLKPDGAPCAARPLPGRPFCLFHDPDQADRLAEARSKGGSTPRRRLRRFPRLLDHYQIAELLGELFMASINEPEFVDCKRLQAITNLARTLLRAVGTPSHEYLEHSKRSEPAATTDHLLRIYPPLSPDVEALLEAELSAAPDLPSSPPTAAPTPPEEPHFHTPPACPPSPDPSEPSGPSEPPPIAPDTERDSQQDNEQVTNRCGTDDPATEADHNLPPNTRAPEHLNTELPTPSTAPRPLSAETPERLHARTPARPNAEQVPNRTGTGPSAMDNLAPDCPPAENPLPSTQSPRAEPPPHQPAPTPGPYPASEETPGISSLRRVTSHSTSAAGWASPNPGYVIRDIPPGSSQW
jgi:hypothetical protein